MVRRKSWWWAVALTALLQSPLYAQSPLVETPSTDLEGKPVTLDRLKDRVTVLIASANSTKDVGLAVDSELIYQFGGDPRFQLIRLVDLVNVPSFAEGIVIDTIKRRDADELAAVRARYEREGRPYPGLNAGTIFVLDWEGKVRQSLLAASPLPEFAVFREPPKREGRYKSQQSRERERLADRLHVFVLDQRGNIVAHYLDAGAAPLATTNVRTLLAGLPPVQAVDPSAAPPVNGSPATPAPTTPGSESAAPGVQSPPPSSTDSPQTPPPPGSVSPVPQSGSPPPPAPSGQNSPFFGPPPVLPEAPAREQP